MIKYAINHEKKQIKAFLEDTAYDAINVIDKAMNCNGGINFCYCSKHMLMHNQYSGTVTLRGGDVWDEEKGKALAKQKCLDNYHKALDKRLNRFYNDLATMAQSIKR